MATNKLRISGTIGSYVSETEKWKIDHDEANACIEFEQLLALGNSSFETISRWDTIWHQKVNEGAILFDAAHEREILNLYKLWSVPSAYMLEEISRHERKGYEVIGAEAFRCNCEDAAGLTTPDNEFFGEELIPLQDEALAIHRRGEAEEFEEMGD